MVWNSRVGNSGSVILPVNEVLSPVLPLLLTSNSRSSFEANQGRVIWDSSVSHISLMVLPVDVVLSPSLPLLLTSDWWGLEVVVLLHVLSALHVDGLAEPLVRSNSLLELGMLAYTRY